MARAFDCSAPRFLSVKHSSLLRTIRIEYKLLKMLLAFISIVATLSTCDCQTGSESSLAHNLLSAVFFPLRHPQISDRDRIAARDFSERYLRALGLNVTRQVFRTTVLFDRDQAQMVEGVNLISLIPGENWNTGKEDDVLLLAAHYDSDVTNLGVRPGSGMVALLEVARNIQQQRLSNSVVFKHTIVLVACDLFTSAHTWGKAGDSGLDIFVKNYLNELLQLRSSIRFRGGIILDSVFNFNSSYETQGYPAGFGETFPDVQMNRVGDFLAAVGRQHSETTLLRALADSWPRGPGRFQRLVLHQQPPRSEALNEVSALGVGSFWSRQSAGVVNSLPAVVLTDTGRFRRMPDGCQVSNRACSPSVVLTRKRMELLNQTVDAVTGAIFRLQGSGTMSSVSWLMTSFMALLLMSNTI